MTRYGVYLNDKSKQDTKAKSFVGGIPKLPKGTNLPTCSLCNSAETFFFQIAFPDDHPWKGVTLAMFACTSCTHEDFLIPEMLTIKLKGAIIPHGFLQTYQRNFHTFVFQTHTGVLVSDYDEKIIFREIIFRHTKSNRQEFGIIGNGPDWILEDESPSTYEGKEMLFLLQIHFENQFEIMADSSKQIELSLKGTPEPSPFGYYQLFIGNEIYLYGSKKPENNVYIWTQVE